MLVCSVRTGALSKLAVHRYASRLPIHPRPLPPLCDLLNPKALLDRLCKREAEIKAGIDGGTVRTIIEHLATRARMQLDGLVPSAFGYDY